MGYTIWPDTPTGEILELINKERYRQVELKEQGKFKYCCADPEISHEECFLVLSEEVGEVSHELNECIGRRQYLNLNRLKTELIQVAAVATAWAEKIDRQLEYQKLARKKNEKP